MIYHLVVLDDVQAEGDTCRKVGAFRLRFDDDRWEWSDAVQALHG